MYDRAEKRALRKPRTAVRRPSGGQRSFHACQLTRNRRSTFVQTRLSSAGRRIDWGESVSPKQLLIK
jgi:hypothetical protein